MKPARLIFSLTLTLCLLEAGSRLLFPRPELENFNRIYYTPLKLFGGIGNAPAGLQPISYTRLRWESVPDGFSNILTLNIYGFRGPDFPARPASKPRIIFIGDSMAEGLGADDGDTLPAQFERLAGGRYEVLNLGVSGTGLPDYARLARDSRVLQPTALVIVTSWNDLPVRTEWAVEQEPPGPIRFSAAGSNFLAAIDELRHGRRPMTSLYSGPFPFFRAVPDSSNPFSGRQNEHGVDADIFRAMRAGRFNPFVSNAARSSQELVLQEMSEASHGPFIDALKEAARLNGADLYFIHIPLHVTVSDRYYPLWNRLGEDFTVPTLTGPEFRRHQALFAQYLASRDIPFIDATPALSDLEKSGRQLFHGYDEHLNAAGYGEVARLALAQIESAAARK